MQALQSLEAIERIARVQNRPFRRKVYRNRIDPFSLDDEDFRKRYRFMKSTATFIINLVREDLMLDRRGSGISPEIQVLTAIRCWGRREVSKMRKMLLEIIISVFIIQTSYFIAIF